jgi:DNA gyrase subunit A
MSETEIPSKAVLPVNIEDEMRESYLDYSMSVIVGRALPDVRDGLKPVHRRILYAMYREGILSNKRYVKCAGVVGEVLKKYHPHGDSAVYDTLVRMAQPWNMRHMLIDGQGNFGSVDGDSAAAYRYTECRLTKLAEELMADIDKDTVDFSPNYDDSTIEPDVFPTRVPNLLVNGSDGIAVGMATKIPPHNLGEIINALLALIKNPELTFEELIQLVPGPDFPTSGMIYGRGGIYNAYKTGRGIVQMRAKCEIEPLGKNGDRESIIITEIPFQTNKAKIIEHIAELVNEGKIEGISDLRDESDRDGMRMVIELKKGAIASVIQNHLFKHTALQSSFGIIMLSIVENRPRILPLKDMLALFLKHRKDVVVRRTLFELREAEKRAHILLGLKIAVENIDEVVALIKKSKTPDEAKMGLMLRFELSPIQAQAILDLRLQRLTGLERDKIIAEYEEILKLITRLKEILGNEGLVWQIIQSELVEIQERFAEARRTLIVESDLDDINIEDLIQKEDMIVTVSHLGYVKRTPVSQYRAQKRGGKGLQGMSTRDEDFVEEIFSASTHDTIMIFSTKGKGYWLKVYEIPEGSRDAKGKAIANLIQLAADEKIAAILPVTEFVADKFVMFATKGGTVKKTELNAYANQRAGGIIAISLNEDELVAVGITNGTDEIVLSTAKGQAIRFKEDDVRSMGRTATGVRGISLDDGDNVVSMDVVQPGKTILTVSERGYGKRTPIDDYRLQGRGGGGVITMKTTDKTGLVVAAFKVEDDNDLMLITNTGKTIRQNAKAISVIGRNTQGVKLFNVDDAEIVVSATLLAEAVEEEACPDRQPAPTPAITGSPDDGEKME